MLNAVAWGRNEAQRSAVKVPAAIAANNTTLLGVINEDTILLNCIMLMQVITPSIPRKAGIIRQFKVRTILSNCFRNELAQEA